MQGSSRRARLARARLYLVSDARPAGGSLERLLPAAIAGGVEIFQLRERGLPDGELLRAARRAVELCREHGALSFVNDRPDIALAAGADGVHVGQEDLPPEAVRELVGEELLLGLSTHSPAEIEAAGAEPVDYIGVGPVYATPTKPGRPAVGTELVVRAAGLARHPFFAIGGLDASNLAGALDAGAERVCVLRAVAEAPDPEAAARELRALLDR
ncbi:MAG: thiamine phosphate synthase [Solirubrobacteraceae bacterium]